MSKMGQHVYDLQNGHLPRPPLSVGDAIIVRLPADDNSNGCCLQGYITARYSDLVKVFGEETYRDSADDKVSHGWDLKFVLVDPETEEPIESVRATVYDWKHYDGGAMVRSNAEIEFHIGGDNQKAVECVKRWLWLDMPHVLDITSGNTQGELINE